MPRAYLRLDPEFSERKRDYPDGPYRALIDTLCAAEAEPKRGTFRSLAVLRALLGRSARHLAYLISHGDLAALPDGRIHVVGWEEWQEGNWQVAERMRRVRARRDGPTVTDVTVGTVTDVTVGTVTVSSEPLAVSGKPLAVAVSSGVTPPTARPPTMTVIDYLESRTGRPYGFGPGSRTHETLSADIRDFGADRLLALMRADPTPKPDISQLVFNASHVLHPITSGPGQKPPSAAERAAAEGERQLAEITARRAAP